VTTDDTDTEVLGRLRQDPQCPAAVLLLAEQGARKGVLAEANERAETVIWDDALGSSGASGSVNPSVADQFHPTNWSREYYSRLRAELEKMLGLPMSAPRLDEH
jgi:hypothetical protein